MSKIYLIVGSSGSFDSYGEWNVRAYTDKDKAEEASELLTRTVRDEVNAWRKWRQTGAAKDFEESSKLSEEIAERTGDPGWMNFDPDDGGIYSVEEIDLDD